MKNFLIKMLWSFKKNCTNPNEQQGLAKHVQVYMTNLTRSKAGMQVSSVAHGSFASLLKKSCMTYDYIC